MSDPVAFLAARLDEDEAAARAAASVAGPAWTWTTDVARGEATDYVTTPGGVLLADTMGGSDGDMAEHIARHDPALVLREIAAKRAILAEHMPGARFCWNEAEQACQRCGDVVTVQWPCATVRQLLSAYSDHSAYEQEWKP